MKIPGYRLTNSAEADNLNTLVKAKNITDLSQVWLRVTPTKNEAHHETSYLKNDQIISIGLSQSSTHVLKPQRIQQSEKFDFIVYEDFDGTTLSHLLKKKQIKTSDALQIALSILNALNEPHQKKITHGNLNPQCILINPKNFHIRIADFRFSSQDNDSHQPSVDIEKTDINLSYVSPEKTGRINQPTDYRSDYYSLGIILYEMLCARLPFDSDDAMEIIHSHIARQAKSPLELDPDHCPSFLSGIIMKLLSKMAIDRYQSFNGLKYDLEYCLKALKQTNRQANRQTSAISSIDLATHDFSRFLRLTSTLYGRENTLKSLQHTLTHPIKNNEPIVLIAGHGGTGKSALAQQLIPQKNDIIFTKGKFEQSKDNLPYSAFIQIIKSLIDSLLSESESNFNYYKRKIHNTLGENASIITELVPSFSAIVGQQPKQISLGAEGTKHRFYSAIGDFFHIFSQEEKQLTILIDDLQWADLASHNLLRQAVKKNWFNGIRVIICYRNNQIEENIELQKTLQILSSNNETNEHTLQNLTLKSITQLLADTLSMPENTVTTLSYALLSITNGNPFFIRQLLSSMYNSETLWADTTKKTWQWITPNHNGTNEKSGTSSLIDEILDKLTNKQLSTLHHGLHLGSKFNLTDIAIVLEAKENELIKQLAHLTDVGLLSHDGEIYYCRHDRLQQAILQRIPTTQKQKIHLSIANSFSKKLSENNKKQRLLEITNHLNNATCLLTTQTETLNQFNLNYQATMQSLNNGAYEQALHYINIATQTLNQAPKAEKKTHYFDTRILQARCQYLNSLYPAAKKNIIELFIHAENYHQKTTCYTIFKNTLISEGKDYPEVISLGLSILQQDGAEISSNVDEIKKINSNLKKEINYALKNKKISNLLDTPKLEDRKKIDQLKLLSDLWEAAYYGADKNLIHYCILSSVTISIHYGNCSESAFGYVLYGMMLTLEEDYEQAYEFGHLALLLNKKNNDSIMFPKVTNLFCNYINFHKKPFSNAATLYEQSYITGKNNGDHLFGLWAAFFMVWSRFLSSQSLNDVLSGAEKVDEFIRQTNDEKMIHAYKVLKNVIETLQGKNSDSTAENIKPHENSTIYWQKHNFAPGLTWHAILQGRYYCIMGEYQKAYQRLNQEGLILTPEIIMFPHSQHGFYHSLALLKLINTGDLKNNMTHDKKIQLSINKITQWAISCPDNFLYQQHLLQAEVFYQKGDLWRATEAYSHAIEAAEKYKLIHAIALTNELTGDFWLQQNNIKLADFHWKSAATAYDSWAAKHKTKQVLQKINQASATNNNKKTIKEEDITNNEIKDSDNLDFDSILKFTHAISQEINSQRLFDKTMKIIIENTGADRGALLIIENNVLLVKLLAEYQDTATLETIDTPLDDFNALPKGIIHYVKRTQQQFILNDAISTNITHDQDYISLNQIQSILCLPVIYKNKLNAILYLENRSSKGIFNEQRANTLNILLTQMETSLHNAQLYQSLSDELQKHKETEKALKTSEYRFQMSHKHANVGAWEWNIETDEFYWSETMPIIFGRQNSRSPITKNDFMSLVHPDDREKVDEAIAACFDGDEYKVDHRIILADGTIRWILEAGDITRDENNQPISMLGIAKDITDRKIEETKQLLLEKQLQQAQKMEAIGQLTGGIAHDFNNMLAVILGYTGLLEDHLSMMHDKKVSRYLDHITTSGKRAAQLTSQMLIFSRGDKAGKELLDIITRVGAVVRMLSSTIPSSIKIHFQYDKSMPKLLLNAVQLDQLIMNICINARDACNNEKGNIHINIIPRYEINTNCSSCHGNIFGDYIEISISDDAGGMPQSIQNAVFDPFFTTKNVGKGTGMGLSIVHGIMHTHQGHILLETEEGKGSCFRLLFPLAKARINTNIIDEKKSNTQLTRTTHALIVDDDAALVSMLCEQLNNDGCHTTSCTNSSEALKLVKTQLDQYDIIITDQTMPDVSGVDLARAALKINPDFPVIICTGYSVSVNEEIADKIGIKKLLHKPITPSEMISAINKALDT